MLQIEYHYEIIKDKYLTIRESEKFKNILEKIFNEIAQSENLLLHFKIFNDSDANIDINNVQNIIIHLLMELDFKTTLNNSSQDYTTTNIIICQVYDMIIKSFQNIYIDYLQYFNNYIKLLNYIFGIESQYFKHGNMNSNYDPTTKTVILKWEWLDETLNLDTEKIKNIYEYLYKKNYIIGIIQHYSSENQTENKFINNHVNFQIQKNYFHKQKFDITLSQIESQINEYINFKKTNFEEIYVKNHKFAYDAIEMIREKNINYKIMIISESNNRNNYIKLGIIPKRINDVSINLLANSFSNIL